MTFQVVELLLPDGGSPFANWFASLDRAAAAKVVIALARLEQGNLSSIEWFRGIGECKIDWGPGYRIYLARDGVRVLLLLGDGTKRRQQRDIDRAISLWEDYKRRKQASPRGS